MILINPQLYTFIDVNMFNIYLYVLRIATRQMPRNSEWAGQPFVQHKIDFDVNEKERRNHLGETCSFLFLFLFLCIKKNAYCACNLPINHYISD